VGFSATYFLATYHGPGVDSVPSENEYQEHFLGVKRPVRDGDDLTIFSAESHENLGA
jgi:hypothetical protein